MHLRIPGLRLRSIGSKPVVSALLAALLATACGTPSPRRQLARHIDDAIATSRATVGVAILLPDGATFTRNDRPLPLLSVFKFPVALAVLDHMERTGRRLSDSLTVGSEWLVADTYSPMRDSLPVTGGAVSLGGLLRYTVSQSDNIACDLLLDLVGGPAAVDEYLGSKGFPEITICADERDMHRDMANQRLNTARPSDISRLFERFLEGGLLSRPHTAFLRQLHHAGRMQGKGSTSRMAVGPSSIPDPSNMIPVHELTTDEIPAVIQRFVDAAVRAQRSGFDGVEIHGAHGYLLAQFLSAGVNKRTDCCGGSISNRARIVCEIIRGIKEACGSAFPVCVRTSGDEGYKGGNSIEAAAAQCLLFEQAGADAVHVSHGTAIHSYFSQSGFNLKNVRRVKEIVSIPVIGVVDTNHSPLGVDYVIPGNDDSAKAVAIYASGMADAILAGREQNEESLKEAAGEEEFVEVAEQA